MKGSDQFLRRNLKKTLDAEKFEPWPKMRQWDVGGQGGGGE